MGSSWRPVPWPTKSLYHLEWHNWTPNLLHKCIHFASGSGVPLTTWFSRIKTILANHSRASIVGQALGFKQSRWLMGDVDRLLKPALGEGLWKISHTPAYRLHCTTSLHVASNITDIQHFTCVTGIAACLYVLCSCFCALYKKNSHQHSRMHLALV